MTVECKSGVLQWAVVYSNNVLRVLDDSSFCLQCCVVPVQPAKLQTSLHWSLTDLDFSYPEHEVM